MKRLLSRLLWDESGATAIEYGLIAALLALAVIGAFVTFGTALSGMFDHTAGTAATVWQNAN